MRVVGTIGKNKEQYTSCRAEVYHESEENNKTNEEKLETAKLDKTINSVTPRAYRTKTTKLVGAPTKNEQRQVR